MPKRYPLPKRFNAAFSEKAYKNLRELNSQYGYGNNYILTILLENLEDISSKTKLKKAFMEFEKEYGAPPKGKMK